VSQATEPIQATTQTVQASAEVANTATGSILNPGGPSEGTFLDFVPRESLDAVINVLQQAANVQETGLFFGRVYLQLI
jgi:hypothetical protein